MDNAAAVEILIVEDNPGDAEMTIRTIRKNHIANNLIHLEDGADRSEERRVGKECRL